jgi:hypothetical protein
VAPDAARMEIERLLDAVGGRKAKWQTQRLATPRRRFPRGGLRDRVGEADADALGGAKQGHHRGDWVRFGLVTVWARVLDDQEDFSEILSEEMQS